MEDVWIVIGGATGTLRTNHPEMSLLRSPADRTPGLPEPVEEDRRTPYPV
jgi:hypothetical protein